MTSTTTSTTTSTSTTARATAGLAPAWYALAVHTRSEKLAAEELRGRVDDVFLPALVQRRAWSDRVKAVEVPVFPGYLFIRTRISAARRVELLRVRHVVDFVGRLPSDERAAAAGTREPRIARAIPDRELEALRLLIASDRALDPVERLVRGSSVLVAVGPLRGVRGVVEVGPNAQRRLIVQIALLGRGVRTVLGADDVVDALQSE